VAKRKRRKHTPIESGAQQGAMGVAYAAKKGKIPVSKLKGPSKEMYESMSKAELKGHLEESKGKDLPRKLSAQQKFERARMRAGARHH